MARAPKTGDRPASGEQDPGSAASAWLKGLQGGGKARFWLSRARRLASGDPRIVLDLAKLLLADGDFAAARTEFAALAETWDVADAWMGLALAAQKLGDNAGAAAALTTRLTRHCLPADTTFIGFATHVAKEAGFGGFRGVSARGTVRTRGEPPLLGETPDKAALARVDGLAAWDRGGVSGWANRPAAPDTPPTLTLTDATGRRRAVSFGAALPASEEAPFLPRYTFRIAPHRLHGLTPPFRLTGPDGPDIMGSPLDPRPLAALPVPAAARGTSPAAVPSRAPLTVLVPVYRGFAETSACLEAALAALPADAHLLVVDDATPEPALAAWLDGAADRFTLLRHETNRGFCAAVNTGLAAALGHDVLLLNADTLVPPGAIETLREVAYADAATGTVTALSNEAAICSYPAADATNPMPGLAGTIRLNALARAANGLAAVEIPTGVGSCLYIRHDCLAATGPLRGEVFAQGYGEENDFCLRARHLGYRHMAAPGAYVAHHGAVSFRAAARGLLERNLALLNRLYPGYHEMIMGFMAADPLAPYRAALDEARLLEAGGGPAVLLVSHSHGGGVARQVTAERDAWRAKGYLPLLLCTQFPKDPANTPYPWPAQVTHAEAKDIPNLAFPLPARLDDLLALLRRLNVQRVVLHHMLGHAPQVRQLAAMLGVPLDIVVHDYASFCPRVNLLTPATPPRYCGEPGLKGCVTCMETHSEDVFETLSVPDLLTRSTAEFAAAETVVVPSADAARRLARHFPGLKPTVTPWEDDSRPVRLVRPRTGAARRRVAVVGGIGPSKGYDLLLACGQDAAARDLMLEFVVIGASADDAPLLETGRIFVTGGYKEGEAQALITAQAADFAFLPSIWPETWCFALSEAWGAGLAAVVFDLGAQAERVKATGRGAVLPLGLPVERLNAVLLSWRF
jgi:GT2 family glycosyltransferase/glycosyltransferase involved in cell wall biosynthesis